MTPHLIHIHACDRIVALRLSKQFNVNTVRVWLHHFLRYFFCLLVSVHFSISFYFCVASISWISIFKLDFQNCLVGIPLGSMEIMNFYALCRLCAKDIGDNGYNCGNCDGLLQTIKDLYGIEVRVCVTTHYHLYL